MRVTLGYYLTMTCGSRNQFSLPAQRQVQGGARKANSYQSRQVGHSPFMHRRRRDPEKGVDVDHEIKN